MKFYDTCALLDNFETMPEEKFIISSITLAELEKIKTSTSKDSEVKYIARKILSFLNANPAKYEVVLYKTFFIYPFTEKGFEVNNDIKILATAYSYFNNLKISERENFFFVTNDLTLKVTATAFLPVQCIMSMYPPKDDYSGYKEMIMDDEMMSDFYSNPTENIYGLKVNEYIIVKNKDGKPVDSAVWTGSEYRHTQFRSFNSKWFGEVKPLKGDIYQTLVADSFTNNKITLVKGPAGSGKTYLSLGYLMSQLERGKIDKIIIFCNTVATKNSAKLGYLPGTKDEKLLDSQIGNVLARKIGSRIELERLMDEEQIVLLPFSDIRGYDTTGMNAGIYISEAQNLDITLMKLALQRIGEDSVCIIDGDEKTQVDDIAFAGNNNGMRRVSKVYRGEDIYGEIELKMIHRSKIAKIAEKM